MPASCFAFIYAILYQRGCCDATLSPCLVVRKTPALLPSSPQRPGEATQAIHRNAVMAPSADHRGHSFLYPGAAISGLNMEFWHPQDTINIVRSVWASAWRAFPTLPTPWLCLSPMLLFCVFNERLGLRWQFPMSHPAYQNVSNSLYWAIKIKKAQ